jgi:hypothetical protein
VKGTAENAQFRNRMIAWDVTDGLRVMTKQLGNSDGVLGAGGELRKEIS